LQFDQDELFEKFPVPYPAAAKTDEIDLPIVLAEIGLYPPLFQMAVSDYFLEDRKLLQ
jgi:hypothetical protein